MVVLSKTDRVTRFSEVEEEIRSINSHARCIPARFGDVDPEMLQKTGTERVFGSAAAHVSGIESFALDFAGPVSKALLERFLALLVDLRGADLLRVKGVVALDTGEHVAVQGVRQAGANRDLETALSQYAALVSSCTQCHAHVRTSKTITFETPKPR